MNAGYPLLVDLRGRRVVVVGAGAVGSRRAAALADAGAAVEVIAVAVDGELDSRVAVSRRRYESSDIERSWLVHACTGDPEVDAQVAADCDAAGIWCVRADDATLSTAWVPAVARVDDVVVSVNAGADPRRAVALRDALKLLLDTGDLMARHRRAPASGSVALVGGGPGDPGLITVRGRRLLAQADVVVVDRLGPRELLDLLPADVDIVEAGKSRDNHTLPQDEINTLLVSLAQQGK
jgi:uroporphyrin-III C-methyltransferase/precorrin-2 dehydrogenase/sirohydrochlorin ferrochelatase